MDDLIIKKLEGCEQLLHEYIRCLRGEEQDLTGFGMRMIFFQNLESALDVRVITEEQWETWATKDKWFLSDGERRAKAVLQEWADKQGHERCHWHPDILQRLANLFEIKPTVEPKLPPREEFESGCRRYQEEQYNA
jgi:hypothetical protein